MAMKRTLFIASSSVRLPADNGAWYTPSSFSDAYFTCLLLGMKANLFSPNLNAASLCGGCMPRLTAAILN
jgi:hypothetical protein